MKCGKVMSDERMRKAQELTDKFDKAKCLHDYERPERKGRAHYVCRLCGTDITLDLVLMSDAIDAEKEPTRSQRLRDAGFTRRPSHKDLPSDE